MEAMQTMIRKRTFTLLEIMIVIFLIGLIGSVIGFNMKGSLDEGKAFKTKQAIQQVEDILTMQLAEEEITSTEVEKDFVACLKKCNLIKSAENLSKDGWNQPLTVAFDEEGKVKAHSEKYTTYLMKKSEKTK